MTPRGKAILAGTAPKITITVDDVEGAKVKPRRPKWGEPGSKVARKTEARVFSRGLRPVFVYTFPDGQIGLRLQGTRTIEYINAADAYRNAVTQRKALERAAKRKGRKS